MYLALLVILTLVSLPYLGWPVLLVWLPLGALLWNAKRGVR